MMDLLLLPVGLIPITAIGYLVVRLLEDRTPVLLSIERWTYAFLVGSTLAMFVAFLLQWIGLVAFTFTGFLIVYAVLLLLLGALTILRRKGWNRRAIHLPKSGAPQWIKILLWILMVWTVVKIAAAFVLLVATPVYPDDVYNNWNMRAKVFLETQELTLELPLGNENVSSSGVSSYPPTVPLIKTWLATLRGQWSEPLVNSIHMLWYLASLALIYGAVRRIASREWALGAVYVLASIPLFLIHGSTPYADAFVAAHITVALIPIFFALRSTDANERASFLRIGALTTALLVFTKNEAMLMHVPPILLLLAIGFYLQRKEITAQEIQRAILWFIGLLAAITIPWLLFKWMHDLPFGNAKPLGGVGFGLQENVAISLWITNFFEGNWLLLPIVFPAVLLIGRKELLRSPLWMLAAFVLIVIAGQWVLYFFTGLSAEAVKQTASARGMIHLLPITVLVTMLLIRDVLRR